GKLRVSEAEKAAKLPRDIQEQIAKLAEDGCAKEARAATHNAGSGGDEKRAAVDEASEKALSFLETYGEECTAFLLDLGNPPLFLKALRDRRQRNPADITPPSDAVPPSTGVPNDDGQARPRSRRTSTKTRIPKLAAPAHAG